MSGKITTRQAKTVSALLTHKTIAEAAEAANVTERTVYRWFAESDGFRAALRAAEGEAIDAATRRLISLQGLALDTLENILRTHGISPAVQLRAAHDVLDFLLKLRDLRNVEDRLTRLEALVNGHSE